MFKSEGNNISKGDFVCLALEGCWELWKGL